MKNFFKSIITFACSIYFIFPEISYAKKYEEETVTVDGAVYIAEPPTRFFSNYNKIGENLQFRGGYQFEWVGLDIESNLRENDKKRWDDELCDGYIYPECLKILNDNNENSTVSFVLGLLNFTGIPHSATSAFSPKPNFLDHDVEKSKFFVNRAADLGLPEALNFRALLDSVDWGKALDVDISQIPPSVEQDLKAAVRKDNFAAKLNLAGLYMDRGSYAEAKVIYEDLSTGHRMAEADYALGIIYLAGYGVPSNYAKARERFVSALFGKKEGDAGPEAYYNLGMMNFKGLGGVVDLNLARTYVTQAANKEIEPAIAALARIDEASLNLANVSATNGTLNPGVGKMQSEKPFLNAKFGKFTINKGQFRGYSHFFQGIQYKNWFLYIGPGQNLTDCKSNLNVWNSDVAKQIEQHICTSVTGWNIKNARKVNGDEQESVHTVVIRLTCQSSRSSNVTLCDFNPSAVYNYIEM
jgi:TPR repeat protein